MRITTNQHLKEMYHAWRVKMEESYRFDESLPAPARGMRTFAGSDPEPIIARPTNEIIQRVIAYDGPTTEGRLIEAVRAICPRRTRPHIKETILLMLKAGQIVLSKNEGTQPWNRRIYSLPI